MISHLELSARAALCRRLASREPDSRTIWLAEAERWSHLTQAPDIATEHEERAKSWCWYVVRKRHDVEMADVPFYSRNASEATARDTFESLLQDCRLQPE